MGSHSYRPVSPGQQEPSSHNIFSGFSRWKTQCSKFYDKNRTLVIAAIIFVTIILAIVFTIIGVTLSKNSERHPTGDEGNWEDTEQGLVFYPVPEDKSIVISFSPSDFQNMQPQPIKQSLDNVLKNYKTINQFDETTFVDCNRSYTPFSKTCRISRNLFGDVCTSERNYGYFGGQPCVFIQLNLPDNVTIQQIKKESHLWEYAKTVVNEQQDPSFVLLTCQGTDSLDKEILESPKIHYGPLGELVMYYPKLGMESYIYRKRNTDLPFLKPGVMVHFTSLVSRQKVHITCTLWGQLYDSQGKMLNHKLLTTQFALFVNHT